MCIIYSYVFRRNSTFTCRLFYFQVHSTYRVQKPDEDVVEQESNKRYDRLWLLNPNFPSIIFLWKLLDYKGAST